MKNNVFVGELKTRIQIKKYVKSRSTIGEPETTEALVKSKYANQIEKSGNEDEAGKVRFIYTTEFICRYDTDLIKGKAADYFIVDEDGEQYDIISVLIYVPKRYIKIVTNRRG